MMDCFVKNLAESGGFEPSIRLRVYRISSAALSTTQTTFLKPTAKIYFFFNICKYTVLFFEKILFSTHFAQDSQGTRNRFYLLDYGIAFASWFTLSIFVLYHTATLRARVDKLNDLAKCI